MPKMKTNSSAKKRFKVTGSGKIKRNRAGTQHMLRNKSKKSKLNLSHSTVISHKGDEKRIKKLLNI